jgi:ATP-dependent DNA ligase
LRKLAREHRSTVIASDLPVDDRGRSLTDEPLDRHRQQLEQFAAPDIQRQDGRRSGRHREAVPCRSGESTAMEKIKNLRSADCVADGFRYAAKGRYVGSLLLRLFDDEGRLNYAGFTSSMHTPEREGESRSSLHHLS